MSDVAIRIDGISKHYRIGNQDIEWYKTLRDTVTNAATVLSVRSVPGSNLRGVKVLLKVSPSGR